MRAVLRRSSEKDARGRQVDAAPSAGRRAAPARRALAAAAVSHRVGAGGAADLSRHARHPRAHGARAAGGPPARHRELHAALVSPGEERKAAGAGVLPRRRLDHRRHRHARRAVPRTGDRRALRRRVGRLSAGAGISLPCGRGGLLRCHALRCRQRRQAEHRQHRGGWRQRGRQSRRDGVPAGARCGPSGHCFPAAHLSGDRSAARHALARAQRAGLSADARCNRLFPARLPAERERLDGLACLAAPRAEPREPAAGARHHCGL